MRVIPRVSLRTTEATIRSALQSRSKPIGVRCLSSPARQRSTPLANSLAEVIQTTGPISVASYMRQCLTSPDGGYYATQIEGRDPFGQKGDFVTSPEISQIFGELVGLWILAEWIAQGRMTSGVHLIELGPGRGTLMDDVLRAPGQTLQNFKPLASSIETVYLVEASPTLREAQKRLLCGDAPMRETDIGHESTSKFSKDTKIVWCEDLRFVPKGPDAIPFIVAHEFFDALPIHIFQSVAPSPTDAPTSTITTSTTGPSRAVNQSNQWRELVVTPTPTTKLSPTPSSDGDKPDFELSVSKTPTPHSLYLPELTPRYGALKSRTGSIIEISPESLALAADIAMRIGGPTASPASPRQPSSNQDQQAPAKPAPSGAALILDYGPSATIPTNSLRGIRAHQACSPFSSAGLVDLSADVDFLALANAALDASPAIEVHGPTEQAAFLGAMGIKQRAEMLITKAEGDAEKVKRLNQGWERLVDRGPNGMGRVYKAMAVVPHVPGKQRRPVGFGGDVSI